MRLPMPSSTWGKSIALIVAASTAATLATNALAQDTRVRCYIITEDAIVYHEASGVNPATFPKCKPVTSDIEEYLQAYGTGNRPKKVEANDPTFFDPQTGNPIIWYSKNKSGDIELFDLMG